MKHGTHSPVPVPRSLVLALVLGSASLSQATILTTSDSGDIAAFQTGATVETFDAISGITAQAITDYNPLDVSGSPALFTKNPANQAYFNSGGASFNDPAGNPGTPIGIVAPSGGIAGDVYSGSNVAGPLGVVTPPSILFDAGAFMEVIFPTGVSKVGLYVTHGSITLYLKDENNSIIATGDATATATAGQFIGISRDNADVRGATILANGAFTIDDFTYGGTSSGGNNGGSDVPDSGSGLVLAAMGCAALFAFGRRFMPSAAPTA